jgi:hypothetical protein
MKVFATTRYKMQLEYELIVHSFLNCIQYFTGSETETNGDG